MIRVLILALLALDLCVSCVSNNSSTANNQPYQPVTKAEKIEFAGDRLDVYPDDVRKNLAAYTNVAVAWVGIIRSTDAYEEDTGDKIRATTVFEHHYFDWVQDHGKHGIELAISPRGEGQFTTLWHLNKTAMYVNAAKAEKYAKPGNLAIVYGVPETVESNGTVILKYRYLRILKPCQFTTNEFDYGRLGEPFHVIHGTNSSPR